MSTKLPKISVKESQQGDEWGDKWNQFTERESEQKVTMNKGKYDINGHRIKNSITNIRYISQFDDKKLT